jgi:hypothetical protein
VLAWFGAGWESLVLADSIRWVSFGEGQETRPELNGMILTHVFRNGGYPQGRHIGAIATVHAAA